MPRLAGTKAHISGTGPFHPKSVVNETVYNRYIGNTGKYYRVEDRPQTGPDSGGSGQRRQPSRPPPEPTPPPEPVEKKTKLDVKKLAESIPEWSGKFRHVIKSNMPAGIDCGDILLILILLFLFIEDEDDDMLLVLILLIGMWLFKGKE